MSVLVKLTRALITTMAVALFWGAALAQKGTPENEEEVPRVQQEIRDLHAERFRVWSEMGQLRRQEQRLNLNEIGQLRVQVARVKKQIQERTEVLVQLQR